MTLAVGDLSIDTARLTLRPISRDDLPFFTRIHADPDVARYLGPGRPRSTEETREWLDRILESYELFQLGQLAVVRKSDGALIGRCGIAYLEIDPKPDDGGDPLGYFAHGESPPGRDTHIEPEIGYTFDRAAWGQGFAREAAAAVYDYAVTRLDISRIVSLIRPGNIRSQRLAESFGAKRVDSVRAFSAVFDRYVWPERHPR